MPAQLPLDPAQAEAVQAAGHLLLVACPGAGKTRTLAAKAARILQDPAARVVAVTFTRDSAREIRSRILAAAPGAENRVLAGTFHGLCYRQLGADPGPVASGSEQLAYAARAARDACADLEAEDALAAIESARAGAERFLPGVDVQRMVRAYEEILLRNGKIDFQDLVLRALRGMEQGRLAPLAASHLLVDEFQDADESQLAWVLAHARAGMAVTAVGDDDQSIYGWRRALGHQGMERFAQALHARRIDLGINYRSRREIVQQAAVLIARNRGRIPKPLRASRPGGGRLETRCFATPAEEARAAAEAASRAGASFAVLARTNRRLDEVEAAFAAAGVSYARAGGESVLEREEARVLGDLLRLAAGSGGQGIDHALAWAGVPEDDLRALCDRFGGRLAAPKRGWLESVPVSSKGAGLWRDLMRCALGARRAAQAGAVALAVEACAAWMRERAPDRRAEANIDYARAFFAARKGSLEERLTSFGRLQQKKSRDGAAVLTTMHGAKGLEWDCVWIVGAEETVTPDGKAPLEEERRLFYVAMTRAREALVISRTNRNPPSRFLSELGLQ